MKTQEIKDLHTKTADELVKLLIEDKKSLINLKLDHQQNKLANTRDIFNTRKKIAVLQTILNLKQNEAKIKVEKPVVEKVVVKKVKAKPAVAKAVADKGGQE